MPYPQPRVVAAAIPGVISPRAIMPAAAPDLAIGDVARLADHLAAGRLWPMIEPVRASARWHEPRQTLTVTIWLPSQVDHPYHALYYHNLEYRWMRLRDYDDSWYDAGWHWTSLPRHDDFAAAQLLQKTLNQRWPVG